MLNVIEYLGRQSKFRLVILGSLFVALMGIFDYLTGPEFFFSVFYLLPVILVTRFVGRTAGVVISIASALVLLMNDVLTARSYSHPVIPYWNMAVELGFFLTVTYILSHLKTALEHEKEAVQERFRREIEIAEEVQSRLFPQILPPMKTLDYAGVCRAARGVSGDYYDFLILGSNKLGIAVGDISGKGISAALLMARLQGLLRSQAPMCGDAATDLVNNINRLMGDSVDGSKYATFFYGLYDDARRTLTYVNAGHNPPMLFQPGESVSPQHSSSLHNEKPSATVAQQDVSPYKLTRLKTGGTVIGLLPDAVYQQETLQMHPGDTLLIFTDGIIEATNDRGEEFGEEQLAALAAANIELSAAALRDLILAEVAKSVGESPQQDDQTLVIAKVI